MRVVKHVCKTDDVSITITVAEFRVILGEMDELKREIGRIEEEEKKERHARIFEYGRTGKISEYDEALSEADLTLHADDCTVWAHDEIFGGKCSCGYWTA